MIVRAIGLSVALLVTNVGPARSMEAAEVVATFDACDYFIADGPRGLYVLEWYGGYQPNEGDRVVGDLSSYGFTDAYYPDVEREGRLWVEDYLESKSAAMQEIADHC